MSETRLDTRGFRPKNDASRELLESIGRSFVTGFGYATRARTPVEAETHLESVDRALRGFAYEGAAMGFAVMDGLGLGGGRCVERFLRGRADRHVYMVYVGVGWALARLPRWRWHRKLPADPLLSWLAVDGYGFHQAYFHTGRYVRERYRDEAFAWPADPHGQYANRVIDQGVGRAIWFVEGADPDRVLGVIDSFPAQRRADLLSGAGLAATYAGGATGAELESFFGACGAARPAVAQGSAFAAKARVRAGLVTPHTAVATAVFCGRSPERAAAVTDDALAGLHGDGVSPDFEVWRRRIADEFVSLGRC